MTRTISRRVLFVLIMVAATAFALWDIWASFAGAGH
jgi:hypothetical protein